MAEYSKRVLHYACCCGISCSISNIIAKRIPNHTKAIAVLDDIANEKGCCVSILDKDTLSDSKKKSLIIEHLGKILPCEIIVEQLNSDELDSFIRWIAPH